jgi:hypothetical protein
VGRRRQVVVQEQGITGTGSQARLTSAPPRENDPKIQSMQGSVMSQHKTTGPLRKSAIVLASATILTVGGSVPFAFADGGGHGDSHRHHGLQANLTGAKEVPGPGDADGRGSATVSLKRDQICFTLSWRNIDAPTAAHIHVGPSDVAGPVVVGLLSVPAPGLGAPVDSVGGCANAQPDLIAAIQSNPRNYYVNIHNVAFPAGAIRGQLH